MAEVVIYTKPGCPYCGKAMTWYTSQGIAFKEKNAQDNPQVPARDVLLLRR